MIPGTAIQSTANTVYDHEPASPMESGLQYEHQHDGEYSDADDHDHAEVDDDDEDEEDHDDKHDVGYDDVQTWTVKHNKPAPRPARGAPVTLGAGLGLGLGRGLHLDTAAVEYVPQPAGSGAASGSSGSGVGGWKSSRTSPASQLGQLSPQALEANTGAASPTRSAVQAVLHRSLRTHSNSIPESPV